MNPTPTARTVACPNCGAAVVWDSDSRFRPFCSERCRLIDLGAWASESYRVPVNDDPAPSDAALPDDTSTRN